MNAVPHLQQHPLSAAFPRPSPAEFQVLKDSIEVIGVQIPITIHDGQVIDGWSRYCAASDLGMDCPIVELGDTDPQDFAKSQTARRNLTTSQFVMVITEIYNWKPAGNPALAQSRTECEIGHSNAELAAIAGASERTVSQAKAVHTNGVPEVQVAVKNGDIGLPKAAAIAKLPKAEQAAALTKPLPKRNSVNADVKDVAFREAEADEPEDPGPDADELAAQEAAEQADRATLQSLLDADDKLATALTEIKRLKAEVFNLKQSRNGYMNELNAVKTLVKKRDFQITQMTKEIEALKRGAA